jgi:hypothetical protein
MKRSPLALTAAALLAVPALHAQPKPPHLYTLFEGANVSVDQNNTLLPVRDIDGASWVVVSGGQEKVISGNGAPVSLKIVPMLKMTEQTAIVSGFKKEPAYTFANDPAVKLTRGLNEAGEVSASYQAAANQASAINPTMITTPSASGTTNAGGNGILGGSASAAQSSYASSAADESSLLNASQDSSGGYDAMTVEFELSSPTPLKDPYLVTTTLFHPPGTESTVVQSLVYAKALPPIGSDPVKVKFTEEGFPVNYQLVEYHMHLYDHGIEVATNVSDKREVMTPEQAFAYVRKTYIASHKGDTLPAAAVMGELPQDLHERLEQGKYRETIYVKVSPDGMADEAFEDAACTKPINDPYLDSVVRTIRFKPALDKGEPVAGVAAVNLSRLRV